MGKNKDIQTIALDGQKFEYKVREIKTKKTIPVSVMSFQCEQCNHIWVPKSQGIFLSKKSLIEQSEELIKNAPKKCPKCNSPHWNDTNETVKSKGGDIEKFKKKLGKEGSKELQAEIDRVIKLDRYKKDLRKLQIDITYFENCLRHSKEYEATLEKELKELEKK